MSINNLLFNNLESIIDNDNAISQSTPSSTGVKIKWAGTDISSITGPTPFVDISKTFEENSSNIPTTIISNITLTGKIIQPSAIGITNVMSGISGLNNLFRSCPVGSLEIICNNHRLFLGSGLRLKDISFNKTEDNWVKSADYSVSLESREPIVDTESNWVQDKSETWSIEPLDEIIYTKFSRSINQKPELHNPRLKPTPATTNSPQPSQGVGGGNFSESNLQILNIPQFRITRRLSAKGVPKVTGTGCVNENDLRQAFLLQAKKWVDDQSLNIFTSGIIAVGPYPPSRTYLYNHTRTSNADLYNGTYEINDSWLAMPTGIPYIESFTIDASTDAENLKTVRVIGNIQGLVLMPTGAMSPNSGVLISGSNLIPNFSGLLLDLSKSLYDIPNQTTVYNVPSIGGGLSATNTASNITSISGVKYLNALQGWLNDIKPYIYRRACFAMRSEDRVYDPINSLNPLEVPPNHIYAREGLLNVVPSLTSEGHDPLKGTISYSYEFNNRLQILSGVLSENIRISNTAPVDNIQEIPIIGRALGPLLFSAGKSNPRKSINVDIVVPKPSSIKATLMTEQTCPMYTGGFLWSGVNTLINGNEPFANRTTPFFDSALSQQYGTVFKESDTEDWNPTEGRYSRSVSWVYQQCTADRFYLDH